MSTAILERIQELQAGPRAAWAPPVAPEVAVIVWPDVLYVGVDIPLRLARTLQNWGYSWQVAPNLPDARRFLRTHRVHVIVSEPEAGGVDMVDFFVALKAGHANASGVPQACQRIPIVLVDGDDDIVALGQVGDAYEAPGEALPQLVLGLLGNSGPTL